MTSGTVNTARKARLSLHCRMVRTRDCCKLCLQQSLTAVSHNLLVFCWVVQEHFCNCVNMPLQRCFNFGLSQWILYVNSVCVYSQAVPYQTVWIIYHSPQLCWFSNADVHLFFLSTLAPDRAPTILSVTPHTTTSVLVRWQVRCWIACFVNRRMNVKRGIYWPELICIVWYIGWILGIKWTSSLCSLPLRIT